MKTVEMMLMSGVLRGAAFDPPRPALARAVRTWPRDTQQMRDRPVTVTGHFAVERLAQVFRSPSWKGLWITAR